jgi:hypothetical protein
LNLLKNRHLLTAAIVTPILALVSYFAVDFIAGEKPHVAAEGASYRLVEKPNCRYDSGRCGLKNGEFELDLLVKRDGNGSATLKLGSAFPLDGVMVALTPEEGNEDPPRPMVPDNGEGRSWSLALDEFDPETDRLRLAASASESLYFGDVALKFAHNDP